MHLCVPRRLVVGCIVASLFAVLPAVSSASPGRFTLPAGSTFTLSNTSLYGCDPDYYGYAFDNGPNVLLGNNLTSECYFDAQPTVTVGPFANTRSFRLLLRDTYTTPLFNFYSGDANHTTITGTTDDWQVQIGDGYTGAAPPSVVYHEHNFVTTLTIGPSAT